MRQALMDTAKPIRNIINLGIGGSDLRAGDGVRGIAAFQPSEPDVALRLQTFEGNRPSSTILWNG